MCGVLIATLRVSVILRARLAIDNTTAVALASQNPWREEIYAAGHPARFRTGQAYSSHSSPPPGATGDWAA